MIHPLRTRGIEDEWFVMCPMDGHEHIWSYPRGMSENKKAEWKVPHGTPCDCGEKIWP